MTPKQIIEAFVGAQELTQLVLPYARARALAALKKALQTELEAIAGNDRALAESFGGRREGNDYVFPDKDTREKYFLALQDAHGEDDETLTLPTVDLSGYTAQLKISADAITALEGIVIFEREDKGK